MLSYDDVEFSDHFSRQEISKRAKAKVFFLFFLVNILVTVTDKRNQKNGKNTVLT